MKEEWRKVVGFEGIYDVSNLGSVRRVGRAARNGNGRGGGAVIGRVRKPQKNRFGYPCLMLYKNGKHKGMLLHRLVAQAFLGMAPKNKEVNHIDGDKKNCRVENLEYLTRGENLEHAYRTGLRVASLKHGEDHYRAKLTSEIVIDCRNRYHPVNCKVSLLAKEYGVSRRAMLCAIRGKSWKHI